MTRRGRQFSANNHGKRSGRGILPATVLGLRRFLRAIYGILVEVVLPALWAGEARLASNAETAVLPEDCMRGWLVEPGWWGPVLATQSRHPTPRGCRCFLFFSTYGPFTKESTHGR